MKKWLPLLCLLNACTNLSAPEFKSLVEEQPRVTRISPADGASLEGTSSIEVEFSQALDVESLPAPAVTFVQGTVESSLLQDVSDFIEEVESNEIPLLDVNLTLDETGTRLKISPASALSPGLYQVVITPALRSIHQVPFNQRPGGKPSPFVATFSFGENFDASTVSSADASGNSADPSAPSPAPAFGTAPDSLVLNELLYDGLSSETDGEAFVELYGTPGSDISLYKVSWINGADGKETDRVTLPPGSLIAQDGIFVIADLRTNSTSASKVGEADFMDQFDPQNGPDAVQLFDRDGRLLDSVTYGTGAVESSSEGHLLMEGTPAADVAGGHSLSRVNGADTNNNSIDFEDLTVPTPGTL